MKRSLAVIVSALVTLGAAAWATAAEGPVGTGEGPVGTGQGPVDSGHQPAVDGTRVDAQTTEDACRLIAHGEYEQAIKVLDAILTRPVDEAAGATGAGRDALAETMFLLGRAHELLGRYDGAQRAYEVVTKEYADSEVFANASLALAELYARAGKAKETVGALEAALDAGLSPAHQFRAQLILAEALCVPGTEVEDLERALALLQKLDTQATRGEDIARVNYGLGFCYQQQNDWKNADAHYVAAVRAAPETPWALFARVRRISYYRQQQFNQDANQLAKQLAQQQSGLLFNVTSMLNADTPLPSAFGWDRRDAAQQAVEAEKPQNGGQAAVLQNAVFNYKDYRIWAGKFVMNWQEHTLQGTDTARLLNETDSTRTVIQGDAVAIDLVHLKARFADNVSFEVTLKKPGTASSRIGDLTELVIDLRTGRVLFRSSEQPEQQ